eukprot:2709557-Rhodomonas_salina.3
MMGALTFWSLALNRQPVQWGKDLFEKQDLQMQQQDHQQGQTCYTIGINIYLCQSFQHCPPAHPTVPLLLTTSGGLEWVSRDIRMRAYYGTPEGAVTDGNRGSLLLRMRE